MAGPRPLLVLAVVAALALAGCSHGSEDQPNRAGAARPRLSAQRRARRDLPRARARLRRCRGRDPDVASPSSSTDSVKLLLSQRTQFAMLDIHDLALAREKGRDIVGIMPLVQVPLAAVWPSRTIARPARPRRQEASASPACPPTTPCCGSSSAAPAATRPRCARSPSASRPSAALLARQVDGATAFWNVEGVALQAKRPAMHEFKVDDYGAPAYPELVLCVDPRELRDDRPRWSPPPSPRCAAVTRRRSTTPRAASRRSRQRPDLDRARPRRSSTPSPPPSPERAEVRRPDPPG